MITLLRLGLFFLLMGCVSTAPYSSVAHRNAVELKVEVLSVLSKATGSFEDSALEVRRVELLASKAMEFAKSIPQNGGTVELWNEVMGPQESLWSEFKKKWSQDGALKPLILKLTKRNMTSGFDAIIKVESSKIGGGGA